MTAAGRRPEEPTEATRTYRRAITAARKAEQGFTEALHRARRGSRKRGTPAAAADYDHAARTGQAATEWADKAAAEGRRGTAAAASQADHAHQDNPHPTAPRLPFTE